MAQRVVAATRGKHDDDSQDLARRATELREDCRKDYNQTGRGARDFYKRALEVAAHELRLDKKLQNKNYANIDIESSDSEAKRLQAREKVSARLDIPSCKVGQSAGQVDCWQW
jgi:hypothetical protein